MLTLSNIVDPTAESEHENGFMAKFWLPYLNDKRDLPFINLLTLIHLTVIPLAVILFTPLLNGVWWWLVFVVWFWLAQLKLRGPFGLMLHNISHRPLFKRKYNWINRYIVWIVCPFFGHTPESYFAHHLGMHHRENNMPTDGSSTMKYNRDSVQHFLIYYFRFLFSGFYDTLRYFSVTKQKRFFRRLFLGEVAFYIFCIVMLILFFVPTLLVFVIPLVFSRLVMMLGNWTQHAFVDPNHPENTYRSSYNCINTPYNNKCWNDGYHLIHHLYPGAHYTDMPKLFSKNIDTIATEKALVFDGLDYLKLFYYLMTKQYDKMAAKVVNIKNVFSSDEEVIQLLRGRTQKIA